jgi:hypothetical protein
MTPAEAAGGTERAAVAGAVDVVCDADGVVVFFGFFFSRGACFTLVPFPAIRLWSSMHFLTFVCASGSGNLLRSVYIQAASSGKKIW